MKSRIRILAIDPGSVRIGLAISDTERRIASPLTTYTRRDQAQDAQFFKKIVEDEEIGLIIVGLPVRADGYEGEQAKAARVFGDWLTQTTGMECIYCDERFTSFAADESMNAAGLTKKQQKARRDRVAAQVLLQTYLESDRSSEAK